jgi:hypothetical protein
LPPNFSRGPVMYAHQTYSHNAPTMDQFYAGTSVASVGSYHPMYAAPESGPGEHGASTGHEGVYTAAEEPVMFIIMERIEPLKVKQDRVPIR